MRKFALAAIVVALGLTACTQIDTGNVGVERTFGKVNPEAQPVGVYATLLDSVDEFTTKEVSFQVNDLSPKSKDNLTLKDLDVDVYFKVIPERIPALFVKYQGDVVRHGDIVEGGSNVNVVGYNRVLRAAREAVYDTVSEFDATTMHTKRAEIAEAIRRNLQKELDTSDKGSFVVTSINVRNLLTDPAIESAIREQVKTDQDILRAQKEKTLAEAVAEKKIAQARGEAESNRIVALSLTPTLVQIRLAEIERDKVIASSKAGNTVITGNVTPLVQVK